MRYRKEFMDAMRAQRRQVLAKVVIDYTDPLIDQSIQVDASERARISWPEQTADGLTQDSIHVGLARRLMDTRPVSTAHARYRGACRPLSSGLVG